MLHTLSLYCRFKLPYAFIIVPANFCTLCLFIVVLSYHMHSQLFLLIVALSVSLFRQHTYFSNTAKHIANVYTILLTRTKLAYTRKVEFEIQTSIQRFT